MHSSSMDILRGKPAQVTLLPRGNEGKTESRLEYFFDSGVKGKLISNFFFQSFIRS